MLTVIFNWELGIGKKESEGSVSTTRQLSLVETQQPGRSSLILNFKFC